MVIDYDEFINIFMNGRGVVAHGPIPPNIWGSAGIKPFNYLVYHVEKNKLVRNSIDIAKQKLALAGYKNGINPNTKMPLQLNYDVPVGSGPDDKARLIWMREQFAKLGIILNIRASQYNRFQDKALNGQLQIFNWGWMADYPDPENFLFLLYGPNSIIKTQGANVSNYNNPEYNKLFQIMRNLPNGKQRQKIIDKMLAIVRDDAPWVWGVHSKGLSLSHSWVDNVLLNDFADNGFKYYYVDIGKRYIFLEQTNQADTKLLWSMVALLFILVLSLMRQLRLKSNKRLSLIGEEFDG
jgi:ABC-type transport system substrate-binding protein